MSLIAISHASDPRIADYANVPDADLLYRRGIFIAEGRLVVRRLIDGKRLPVRSVLVTGPGLGAIEDLLPSHPDLPVYVVPQAVMNGITGFNVHRGCLAIGERPAPRAWRDVVAGTSPPRPGCARPRVVVVLERVGNADNVGSIFRNSAALGANAILLGPDCADPLYRKAIRTSMAAALSLPFATLEPWPDALDDLVTEGFVRVALTPSADARLLAEVIDEYCTTPARVGVAIVVGHEGEGLSTGALAHCDERARIPMVSGVDSLNVATATAIALYECYDSER